MFKRSQVVGIKLVFTSMLLSLASLCYGEYVVPLGEVELKCGPGPLRAPKTTLPGHPSMYYRVTLVGIKERGEIIRVEKNVEMDRSEMIAGSKQRVTLSVDCGSAANSAFINTTGADKTCNKNEALILTLMRPNHATDPDKFHGVVDVEQVWDSKAAYEKYREMVGKQLEREAKESIHKLTEGANKIMEDVLKKHGITWNDSSSNPSGTRKKDIGTMAGSECETFGDILGFFPNHGMSSYELFMNNSPILELSLPPMIECLY